MVSRDRGPTLLVALPRERLQADRMQRLIEALRDTPRWQVPVEPDAAQRLAERIVRERHTTWGVARYDWEPWSELGRGDPLDRVPFSHLYLDNYSPLAEGTLLPWREDLEVFSVYSGRRGTSSLGPFPPDDDPAKVDMLLGLFERGLEALEPDFALVADHGQDIHARKGEDLRKRAWGVTVYGPDLVEALGEDVLLKAPAWRARRLPWGGVWVQAAPDPFRAPTPARKAIERALPLSRL